MTCVIRLRNPANRNRQGLTEERVVLEHELDLRCLDLIKAEVRAQEAEADRRTEDAQRALAATILTDQQVLSDYLKSGPGLPGAKWIAALDLLATRERVAPPLMARYRAVQTTPEILDAFKHFNRDYRNAISEAIRKGELK